MIGDLSAIIKGYYTEMRKNVFSQSHLKPTMIMLLLEFFRCLIHWEPIALDVTLDSRSMNLFIFFFLLGECYHMLLEQDIMLWTESHRQRVKENATFLTLFFVFLTINKSCIFKH